MTVLLCGCSTLGFGDFESDEQFNKNSVEVKFVYQPLIGGKHNIFLAGDFNDWSETATRMNEKDGLYEVNLDLEPGKYGYKFLVDGKWIINENVDEFLLTCYNNYQGNSLVNEPSELA